MHLIISLFFGIFIRSECVSEEFQAAINADDTPYTAAQFAQQIQDFVDDWTFEEIERRIKAFADERLNIITESVFSDHNIDEACQAVTEAMQAKIDAQAKKLDDLRILRGKYKESVESWDKLMAENDRLKAELMKMKALYAQCTSELSGLISRGAREHTK